MSGSFAFRFRLVELVDEQIHQEFAKRVFIETPKTHILSNHAWDQAYNMRDEVKRATGRTSIRNQIEDDIRSQ